MAKFATKTSARVRKFKGIGKIEYFPSMFAIALKTSTGCIFSRSNPPVHLLEASGQLSLTLVETACYPAPLHSLR